MTNTSRLSVILGVEGVERVIADANRAKDALNKSLGSVQSAAGASAGSMKKLETAVQGYALQSIGATGATGQLARGMIALGGAVNVALAPLLLITLAIAAVTAIVKEYKEDQRDLLDSTEDLARAQDELAIATGAATSADIDAKNAAKALADEQERFNKVMERAQSVTTAWMVSSADLETAYNNLSAAHARASAANARVVQEHRRKEEEATRKANAERAKSIAAEKQFQSQLRSAGMSYRDAVRELQVAVGTMTPDEAVMSRLFEARDEALATLNSLKASGADDKAIALAQLQYDAAQAQLAAGRQRQINDERDAARKASDDASEAWSTDAARIEMEQYEDMFASITTYADIATEAWMSYWDAVFSGKNGFAELARAAAQALQKMARLEMMKETAKALGSLAEFYLFGSPSYLKSAQTHFASAAMWGVLSAGAGAVASAGGGSGGRGGSDNPNTRSSNAAVANSKGPTTNITIVGDPYFDTRDPDKMDALVRAIREAGNGDIVIRGA